MPLVDLDLVIAEVAVPGDVRRFLREAERRIEEFQVSSRIHGFVPSQFERAYAVLRSLSAGHLAPGTRFCEWGSGFGVVACLAAMLDFDAYGIEIEGELVEEAQRLADDFGLPVEFVHGSFIPRGGEVCVDAAYIDTGCGFAWLTTESGQALEDLGLSPEDFDVISAYPWPDEEEVIGDLFEHCAAVGTVLVTHHGSDNFRLRRKSR